MNEAKKRAEEYISWSDADPDAIPIISGLLAECERMEMENNNFQKWTCEKRDLKDWRNWHEMQNRITALESEKTAMVAICEQWKINCEALESERDLMQVHIDKLTEGRSEELKHAENVARIAAEMECVEIIKGYAMNEDNMLIPVHDGHAHAKFVALRAAHSIRHHFGMEEL